MKNIVLHMIHPNMSAAQYDGTVRDLEAAGMGKIPERLYHVAAPNGDGWHVTDVWESQEALDRFMVKLGPILEKHTEGEIVPIILNVHNIIIP